MSLLLKFVRAKFTLKLWPITKKSGLPPPTGINVPLSCPIIEVQSYVKQGSNDLTLNIMFHDLLFCPFVCFVIEYKLRYFAWVV